MKKQGRTLRRPRSQTRPIKLLAVPSICCLFLLEQQHHQYTALAEECDPCQEISDGYVQIPNTECSEFVNCNGGVISQRFSCQSGLIFDKSLSQCNWAYSATCGPDIVCPTPEPTKSPSGSPTTSPSTYSPTVEPEGVTISRPGPAPTGSNSTNEGTNYIINPPAPPPTAPIRQPHFDAVFAHIYANKITIANQILSLSQRMHAVHSTDNPMVDKADLRNYAFMDFIRILQSMAEEGYVVPLADQVDANGNPILARNVFYLGDPNNKTNGAAVGLINVAIFLSQALAESIANGSCDEMNTDAVDGFLPSSNACGQYGRSYQSMYCSDEERFMECPVDEGMMITAEERKSGVTPFYCGPTSVFPFTGTANYMNGKESSEFPVENRNQRTDVQGCCWWGRGTIQTRGICQYGKLNYYLGARAHQEGRPARYPTIDFCTAPQTICSSNRQDSEIEWVSGLFRWVDTVQSYNVEGWNYISKLREFVEGGMVDGMFIHGVTGIVTQGCHDTPCEGMASTGEELKEATERWAYFRQVAQALGLSVKGGGSGERQS